MPKFDNDGMENHGAAAGSHYGFSATRINNLGATEYTLVAIAVDVSTSVRDFAGPIEAALKEIVAACRRSPRSDNLLLRIVTFCESVSEMHGFRPLSECDLDKYTGSIAPQGWTALYDASCNAVESVGRYGRDLVAQDFDCNGIVVVVTDGEDNRSKMTPRSVKAAVSAILDGEELESLRTILIGVNAGPAGSTLSRYLSDLKDEAGFDQYVAIEDASEKNLAKVAAFVSKSISSQSQALGSGGSSQALNI